MTADSASRAGRGEEHDGIAHKLDIVLERFQLVVGQLGVSGVELKPVRAALVRPGGAAGEATHFLSFLRSMGNALSVPAMVVDEKETNIDGG